MCIPVFLAILLIALCFQLNAREGFDVESNKLESNERIIAEGFTPLWASEDKKDYSGNDIAGSPFTNISLGDCKKKCIGDATCKGIVTDFTGDGPGSNCWMKSVWGEATDNDSRFAYKLSRR